MVTGVRVRQAVTAWILCVACASPGSTEPQAPAEDEPSLSSDLGIEASQLRMLSRRELIASVEHTIGLPGSPACTETVDCVYSEQSCVEGTCSPDPCGLHTFVLQNMSATSVLVSGTFNNWAESETDGALVMTPAGTGDWWTKRSLGAGSHAYKYIVDGVWILDPGNPRTVTDGAYTNSLLELECDGAAPADPSNLSVMFPVDTRPEGWPYDNHATAGSMDTQRLDRIYEATRDLAKALTASGQTPCAPAEVGCADTTLNQWGPLLFRRPLPDVERERYRSIAHEGSDPQSATEDIVAALLSSPHHVYRMDGGPEATLFDLATFVAFATTGRPPDAQLHQAAEDSTLASEAVLAQEIDRLLATPAALEHLGAFVQQWFDVTNLPTVPKQRTMSWQARTDALSEITALVVHHDASFGALMRSPDHMVSDATASLYGVPSTGVPAIQSIPERPGLLGTVAVLASAAHSDQSSPVLRGLLVREQLLCQPLGTPPPDAGGVPAVDPNVSIRDRFAQHSNDPACSVCHDAIDPIGFAMGHYDELGGRMDLDAGQPVDATGNLLSSLGGTDHPVDGLPELVDAILAHPDVQTCAMKQLYRFTIGQEVSLDHPILAAMNHEMADHDGDMRHAIRALLLHPMQLRRWGLP